MAKQIKKSAIGCPTCGGGGFNDAGHFCPDCKGVGKINVPESLAQKCPECGGRGQAEGVPCKPCAHTGQIALPEITDGLAATQAAKDAAADEAALQAKLADAFEAGRQAAFQELGGTDAGKLKDVVARLKADKKALKEKLKSVQDKLGEPADPPEATE